MFVNFIEGMVEEKGSGGGDGIESPNNWAGGDRGFMDFGEGSEGGNGWDVEPVVAEDEGGDVGKV